MSEQTSRPRYYLLDELRGIAIILMVIFHAFVLLADVFYTETGRALYFGMRPVQPFIAGTFILICGICCRFSRSNGKRGLRLLGAALLVTLATWATTLFGLDMVITFGVLHFLAVAVLLFTLLDRPLERLPLLQIIVFTALFVASVGPYYAQRPGFGAGDRALHFPETALFPLYVLGFPSGSLYSADYFPLIPWLFLFFAGTALGIYGRAGRFPAWFAKSRIPPLQWLGRHSLLIYLLHQPVLMGLMALVFAIKNSA